MKPSERHPSNRPERGLFLEVMYRFYAYYLGVTPPRPENEMKVAVLLLGAVALFLVFLIVIAYFLATTILSR